MDFEILVFTSVEGLKVLTTPRELHREKVLDTLNLYVERADFFGVQR